jgi:molecular chaperone Hsp33
LPDYIIRAQASGGKVRAIAASTTGIVEELRRRHNTTPTATAALGRTVTAALMMGAMMKGEERLTVQVKGGGPIGQIVADANAKGEVRGYVDEPGIDLPLNNRGKLDVAGAVGTEGYLYVTKDLGLKEPYRGSVPIVSGELGEDFTYYFSKSEQTPSAVALGVLVDVDRSVKAAGGLIIQLLPGVEEEDIVEIERQIANMPPITQLIDRGDTMEQIVEQLLDSPQTLQRMDAKFQCQCSRERVRSALVGLGKQEITDMLEEDGKAEVVCHFCNETYEFSKEDLEQIAASL